MKQTATEWLFEKLWDSPKDKLTWNAILEQAKQMEKQQIENARIDIGHYKGLNFNDASKHAQQYYKETYDK
jgi:predicted HTH transcriptional regulator